MWTGIINEHICLMDQSISNVCIIHNNHFKGIDDAVWKNFLVRELDCSPFYAIEHKEGICAVVSDDILELFDHTIIHPLFGDYIDMDYDHIASIFRDKDPLDHWSEIKGMVSVTDHRVLRFILEKNIPIEKFIRHELATTGFDEKGTWCGIDKSKEIWLK